MTSVYRAISKSVDELSKLVSMDEFSSFDKMEGRFPELVYDS
jgi:hypothetical protein